MTLPDVSTSQAFALFAGTFCVIYAIGAVLTLAETFDVEEMIADVCAASIFGIFAWLAWTI